MLGSKRISFEASIALDTSMNTVIYWEKLSERTSGVVADIFLQKFSKKAKLRNELVSGKLPCGDKYQYNFGDYRKQIQMIAESSGQHFKTVIKKP